MALSTSPPRAKMQLAKRGLQQFSLWPLRSAPGSLGTYGFLTPPYGLPYGLELKNNPRLCTSLRVYASNTPQEAAILIYAAAKRRSENCRAPKAKMRIAAVKRDPNPRLRKGFKPRNTRNTRKMEHFPYFAYSAVLSPFYFLFWRRV